MLLLLLDRCGFLLNFITNIMLEFEFLMTFENFDNFQYLIETNKMEPKLTKIDILHY